MGVSEVTSHIGRTEELKEAIKDTYKKWLQWKDGRLHYDPCDEQYHADVGELYSPPTLCNLLQIVLNLKSKLKTAINLCGLH